MHWKIVSWAYATCEGTDHAVEWNESLATVQNLRILYRNTVKNQWVFYRTIAYYTESLDNVYNQWIHVLCRIIRIICRINWSQNHSKFHSITELMDTAHSHWILYTITEFTGHCTEYPDTIRIYLIPNTGYCIDLFDDCTEQLDTGQNPLIKYSIAEFTYSLPTV